MRLVIRFLILSLIVLLTSLLGACSKSDTDKSPENTSTLIGTVEEITATTWTIDDKVVQVDDEVSITGNILVGDQVEALVTLGENATLQALEIEFLSRGSSDDADEVGTVDDDGPGPVELSGIVELMDDDTWTVSGKRVMISSQTDIRGNKHLGKTVWVHAYPQEDGSYLAIQIKPIESGDTIEKPGEPFDFVGIVQSMDGDTWIVGSRVITITAKTEIDPGIDQGAEVKVEGVVDEERSLVALEIQLIGTD
jgi:hypothetical protein